MDLIIGIFLFIIGLYILYISIKSIVLECPKTIEYRYIPRTFEEEQRDPIRPSVIFKDMFTLQQPFVAGNNLF